LRSQREIDVANQRSFSFSLFGVFCASWLVVSSSKGDQMETFSTDNITSDAPTTKRIRSEKDVAKTSKGLVVSKALPVGWTTWILPNLTVGSMHAGTVSTQKKLGVQTIDDCYEELLDVLGGDSYTDHVCFLTSANNWLYTILTAVTFNVSFCRLPEDQRIVRQKSLRFVFELIIGWLVRLFNSRCWVLPIVILSLWAWKCRVPKPFWTLLTSWRLLYSKETTEMIAKDLGLRVQRPRFYPGTASRKVILAVFDNCLCKFGTSFEGVREDGDGSVSYLFINWFLAPIDAADVPDDFDPGGGDVYHLFFTFLYKLIETRDNKGFGVERQRPTRSLSGSEMNMKKKLTRVNLREGSSKLRRVVIQLTFSSTQTRRVYNQR
jgi:hypothetical protein